MRIADCKLQQTRANKNAPTDLFLYTDEERLRTIASLDSSPIEPQENVMAPADEPSKPRRRRGRRSHATRSVSEAAGATPAAPRSLEEAIEHERVHLMQIQAMLKCLYEVLLYADDDDTLMHADVANVAARLIDDSVARLDVLRGRVAQPAAAGAQVEDSQEDIDPSLPRHHQVKDPPAAYLC